MRGPPAQRRPATPVSLAMGTMVAARHPEGDSCQLPHPPRAARPCRTMTRHASYTHPASASCQPASAGNRTASTCDALAACLSRVRGLTRTHGSEGAGARQRAGATRHQALRADLTAVRGAPHHPIALTLARAAATRLRRATADRGWARLLSAKLAALALASSSGLSARPRIVAACPSLSSCPRSRKAAVVSPGCCTCCWTDSGLTGASACTLRVIRGLSMIVRVLPRRLPMAAQSMFSRSFAKHLPQGVHGHRWASAVEHGMAVRAHRAEIGDRIDLVVRRHEVHMALRESRCSAACEPVRRWRVSRYSVAG